MKFSVNFTSKIAYPSRIKLHKDKITIGSFVLSGNCYFQAYNGIDIGKNFLFAPGVKLISSNHDIGNISKSVEGKPIIIGDNVWVGANAVILPGVKLGNHCVVGAGSVVSKSFDEDNLIIGGNPAKIIKSFNN
jgi:acetyltransferase-like isoleucine patch superfamily enzyme